MRSEERGGKGVGTSLACPATRYRAGVRSEKREERETADICHFAGCRLNGTSRTPSPTTFSGCRLHAPRDVEDAVPYNVLRLPVACTAGRRERRPLQRSPAAGCMCRGTSRTPSPTTFSGCRLHVPRDVEDAVPYNILRLPVACTAGRRGRRPLQRSPIAYCLFPIPYSLFLIPSSLNPTPSRTHPHPGRSGRCTRGRRP